MSVMSWKAALTHSMRPNSARSAANFHDIGDSGFSFFPAQFSYSQACIPPPPLPFVPFPRSSVAAHSCPVSHQPSDWLISLKCGRGASPRLPVPSALDAALISISRGAFFRFLPLSLNCPLLLSLPRSLSLLSPPACLVAGCGCSANRRSDCLRAGHGECGCPPPPPDGKGPTGCCLSLPL